MKHSRSDYDRIQDPALWFPNLLRPGSTPIALDEPVFLIRGQDTNAAAAVRQYAALAQHSGAAAEFVARCLDWADAIEQWQASNCSKVPDIPKLD